MRPSPSYESMSACKPHPHFFSTLVRRVGCEPWECLMVGDSVEADMPARRVGCKTFWVDRDPVPRPLRSPGMPKGHWRTCTH